MNTQLRVLIVDDDSSTNQVMAEHLRYRGFEPISMFSGQTALKYLDDHEKDAMPGVILLDVLMPGMNGCQVLQELRTRAATREIPVILLSVLSQEEIKDQLSCPCAGYDAYINKPFDMREVVRKLEGVVRD